MNRRKNSQNANLLHLYIIVYIRAHIYCCCSCSSDEHSQQRKEFQIICSWWTNSIHHVRVYFGSRWFTIEMIEVGCCCCFRWRVISTKTTECEKRNENERKLRNSEEKAFFWYVAQLWYFRPRKCSPINIKDFQAILLVTHIFFNTIQFMRIIHFNSHQFFILNAYPTLLSGCVRFSLFSFLANCAQLCENIWLETIHEFFFSHQP